MIPCNELAASFLALLADVNLMVHFGTVPWISISLVLSFGLYGLLKKMVGAGAINGLALDTLIMLPLALIYLMHVQQAGQGALSTGSPLNALLLIGAGVVTAAPLILFSVGTLNSSLIIVGFLQYISPTLTLLLGIFLYHEAFTRVYLNSFVLIWLGLAVFSLFQLRLLRQAKKTLALS